MTEQEIREIEEREKAATPGPWRAVWTGNTVKSHRVYAEWTGNIACGISPKTGNADFIAHAREDVPRLLDEVKRLQAENEEWRQINDSTDFEYKKLKAELDVVKRDMHTNDPCQSCKWLVKIEKGRWRFTGPNCEYCMDEDDRPSHEWRGPCAENGGKDK